jgi:hypothetical protein
MRILLKSQRPRRRDSGDSENKEGKEWWCGYRQLTARSMNTKPDVRNPQCRTLAAAVMKKKVSGMS